MAKRVCPWWLGYFLMNPLRRWRQAPDAILAPHVRPGMTVADIGCGMGFFSLPLALLAGENGRVVCVDLQERMLASLRRRGEKAGLAARLDVRLSPADTLGLADLAGRVDFALAFAVVHEVPSPERFFAELHRALKPGGKLLFAEPVGHVNGDEFEASLALARAAGFAEVDRPKIARSRAALLRQHP